MANRTTIKDVAREAGVSVTTVDRAINGRGTVRPDTLKKIAEAAQRVGYHGMGTFRDRLDQSLPEVKLGFVLLKQTQEFYRNFAREIDQAVAARTDIRGEAIVRFSSSQSPAEFAEILTELGETCDAIAGAAVNDQKLDRIVQDLKDKNVPVFSLLNDFAQGIRKNYVGLNNMKVGRLAAWLITKTVHEPGKLAIFVGGNRWHGHDLREVGFRSFVREAGPEFSVLDTLVNLETRQLTYEATLDLLDRHPDLKGIYVAGGGMEGAIAALRERHAEPQVALIVNELTGESRAALVDGYAIMAIATPLPELCRELVDMMIVAGGQDDDGVPGQYFLEPRLHLPEIV
ncbi:LacI family DNA-binding transcriptional regulator [Planktomarina temperata]|jgi:LacI family transcriptional regulator|nr:LacI family DNA-binding transcriptional regulator [Planktomarina temperata]MDA8822001.1 LacI family DNA-binding transcriptional regulator [Planktomarina temperata]MDA8987408.1 LacI family DNA-binding transcriptional regulator [Planktomarina temperata]MDA9324103.1 LacI family DNA-binding transcriptional regulator [bacterium]MDB4006499.1 LacI family DNA-binding transcriptional regulator [Planktomarina temperata]